MNDIILGHVLELLLGLSQLLQKLFATSVGAVSASVEAVAASTGALFGIFG